MMLVIRFFTFNFEFMCLFFNQNNGSHSLMTKWLSQIQ
ncbi:hypothetical protein yrohd0001_37140 [Yersinia rohdei ATCC 43380]|nr:hypothetical protein yrohd0001_37140 [Yersinia rohdei ATCC 43380]